MEKFKTFRTNKQLIDQKIELIKTYLSSTEVGMSAIEKRLVKDYKDRKMVNVSLILGKFIFPSSMLNKAVQEFEELCGLLEEGSNDNRTETLQQLERMNHE